MFGAWSQPENGRNEQVELTSYKNLGELQMPHAMLRTSENVISGILNWVCPECGGRMGGPTKEFKCQGQCRRDWRAVWESRLAKSGKNTNSPQAPGKQYEDYAPNGAARVVVHKFANRP